MPQAALRELLSVVDLPQPDEGDVTFSGAEPAVRTRYRVGTAGAAVQAAIGVALSKLWKLKTGRGQKVQVGVRPAAFGLRGDRHFFVDGKPIREPRDPWNAYVPVKDGRWVRLHMNFAHHVRIAREVLGMPADIDAARKVSAGWDGVALEDAIHAAGGVAAFVRTREEWANHPQLAADNLPLVEIVRIGDAPVEPMPSGNRPLAGIRVVELTRVLAGPVCARTLAEHGADVIKVDGAHLPVNGNHDLVTGMGKLSTFIDLRSSEGVDTLRGLLREADVFSQGYRPGSLAGRGFSPEDAAKIRPGIVCVELSAWGAAGPWKSRRGFDTLVQSVRGWAMTQGGEKPSTLPVSAVDYVCGYLMALGVIVALGRRATEGGSWLVRTSLTRTARFIEDRGLIDLDTFAQVPDEPASAEIEPLLTETRSSSGLIRHLRSELELSETSPYWTRPPVPLGSSEPVWPSREGSDASAVR